jgi:tetratricopeptide (TPR) repeat protein
MNSPTIRCPDCGTESPAGSASCTRCNFPLEPGAAPPAPAADGPAETSSTEPPPPASGDAALRPIRPFRPRPPRERPAQQASTLWLVFAAVAAAIVIYTGVKANLDRASEPVEGAAPAQQERVDQALALLARDSTNVDARVALADVLYDTANWQQAIDHYRVAIAADSSRVAAIVDLGVCYYNLGEADEAERTFHLALAKDPTQPVALFNLGILHERRKDMEESLKYFHRALASNPPEDMKPVIIEAMQRVQQATGTSPPPLPGNSP